MWISWLFLLLTSIGTYLNAKKLRVSFLLWTIANIYFIYYHIQTKDLIMITFFSVGMISCIYGYFNWNSKKK